MIRIDYQKYFDSVPHSWVIKSLELVGTNNKIIYFTKKTTSYWKTNMRLHTEES
jgi:Reverse transcriptase (RNA-dependent DNA polymerase).